MKSSSQSTPMTAPSRRTKYEIWAELLESCAWNARTQSWLMRKLGVKTKIIKEALAFLVNARLLTREDESEPILFVYKTSEKGKKALQRYYELVTEYFTR